MSTFRKGEGIEFDAGRHPVVKTAFVINHLGNHPRGGGTADDENEARVFTEKAVPKVIESLKEARTRARQPWQLVEEDDILALSAQCFEVVGELLKGFLPRPRAVSASSDYGH